MRKLLIVLLAIFFVTCSAYGSDLSKELNDARDMYDKRKENLDPDEQAIIEQYIALLEKSIERNDREIIKAYGRIYSLSREQYQETRGSTLFREFHFDYSGIPLIISQICRDSSHLMPKEKAVIIQKQLFRRSDPRIGTILVNHIKAYESYPEAIDYCVEQVSGGNNNFLIPLAKLRIEYQRELVQKALDEKGIEAWKPNVIEHNQLSVALSEARESIAGNPIMVVEYDRVFHEAFDLLNVEEKAASFYEFALTQSARLAPTNADLVSTLNNRLSEYRRNVK